MIEQQLIDYVTKHNAETQAWVDAKEGRWAGFIPTETSWFESNGWTTLKSYKRAMLEESAYYMCADAYSKSYARAMNFKMKTNAELDALIEEYSKTIDADLKEQSEWEEKCVVTFKSILDHTVAHGAGDEKTALRWLVDDSKFYSVQCIESFVYGYGILFTKYGKEVVEQLKTIVTFEEYA